MIAITLFVGLMASCGGNSDNDVPLIFAAASLSDVLTESAEIYERETGKRVDFSFGGSIALANQIVKLGAPADGVLFAGDEPGRLIAEAGLRSSDGAPGRVKNSLVVVGGLGTLPINSLSDLVLSGERVAIANPELAPAGRYAMQALGNAGVPVEISDQLIFTSDVRAALAAVESGNAKYGIVYGTDAYTSERVDIVMDIDGAGGGYYFTGIAGARNGHAAQTFLNYIVIEPETREVFESAGFEIITTVIGPGSPGG